MARKKESVVDTATYQYDKIAVRGVDGKIRYSQGTGDAVARAMLLHFAKGGSIKDVIEANRKAFDDAEIKIDAKGTNQGLVRMKVGNSLRGLVRNGVPVKIGSVRVEKLTQKVELPKVESKAPGAAKKAAKSKATKSKKARAPRKPKTPNASVPAQEGVSGGI